MKKLMVVLVASLAMLFTSQIIFVQDTHAKDQRGVAEGGQVETTAKERSIEVGNKICPVMGKEIKKGEAYKFEFEGKIYSFCCPMCINEFKKDPQKYIDKLEEMEQIL